MLANGTDISNWAKQRNAQSLLPKLIRRILFAKGKRLVRLSFPSGEGVQFKGWDGIVEAKEGNICVPEGLSVWELSTEKDIKGKADSDYEKRKKDTLGIDPTKSTFVFLTPRLWGNKVKWVEEKRGEGFWRDVRAYDGVDIETWLETAPAVHLWFSIILGKYHKDAVDLESYWVDWSETTRPVLSHEILLSGREEIAKHIYTWLKNPTTTLALKAESREESLAVFASAIQQLTPEEQDLYLSHAIVVRDVSAWFLLAAYNEPLILIPLFDCQDVLARATRIGHQVVIPLGTNDSTNETTIEIPSLSWEDLEKNLRAKGETKTRAHELAILAHKSFLAFRRKIALRPELQQPEWATVSYARSLLPAIFVGAWDESKDGDKEAISKLANIPYDDIREILLKWSQTSDPPLHFIGRKRYLVSKEDSWTLLIRYITRGDIEIFKTIVLDVLGTPDPRFDLPVEKRWMSEVIGKKRRFSEQLYNGIAETLAIMAVHSDKISTLEGISFQDFVNGVAQELLERANTNWRIWASLSQSLSFLAEAAPNVFLASLNEGLESDPSLFFNLFTDHENSAFFISSPHIGLLWALETLAWNSEFLAHTALILAKLARLDPGGKYTNRPLNTLREIFLFWDPQTKAFFEQRIRVIDTLLKNEPEIAWGLLSRLLPKLHYTWSPTRKPLWRDWTIDFTPKVTQREILQGFREILVRMLTLVGEDGNRWKDLLDALPTLPKEDYKLLLDHLLTINTEKLQHEDLIKIRDTLRSLISRHRSFADTDWALPREDIDYLEKIHRKLEADDLIVQYGWLFSERPEMPEGLQQDHTLYMPRLEEARFDAIKNLYSHFGLNGVITRLNYIKKPLELGISFGKSEFLEQEEDEILSKYLAHKEPLLAEFARGFILGRIIGRGRDWVESKIDEEMCEWTSTQFSELLLCLPCDDQTWDIVNDLNSDITKLYWRSVKPYRKYERASYERVTRKLLEYDRPNTAIFLIALNIQREKSFSAALIAEVLEKAIQTPFEKDPPKTIIGYHIAELFDSLEKSDFDKNRIAKLEWAFLPVLRHYNRSPHLLHQALTQNPSFFISIINTLYLPEGEKPHDLSEEEQARVKTARELLHSLHQIPGFADDGTANAEFFESWIENVRELAISASREKIVDEIIGELLSNSPKGKDGIWPHQIICDFIEKKSNSYIEGGFEVVVIKSRGVVSKKPTEGGVQERKLAEKHDQFSLKIRDEYPRTATMLRQIADHYREIGKIEDQRTRELFE